MARKAKEKNRLLGDIRRTSRIGRYGVFRMVREDVGTEIDSNGGGSLEPFLAVEMTEGGGGSIFIPVTVPVPPELCDRHFDLRLLAKVIEEGTSGSEPRTVPLVVPSKPAKLGREEYHLYDFGESSPIGPMQVRTGEPGVALVFPDGPVLFSILRADRPMRHQEENVLTPVEGVTRIEQRPEGEELAYVLSTAAGFVETREERPSWSPYREVLWEIGPDGKYYIVATDGCYVFRREVSMGPPVFAAEYDDDSNARSIRLAPGPLSVLAQSPVSEFWKSTYQFGSSIVFRLFDRTLIEVPATIDNEMGGRGKWLRYRDCIDSPDESRAGTVWLNRFALLAACDGVGPKDRKTGGAVVIGLDVPASDGSGEVTIRALCAFRSDFNYSSKFMPKGNPVEFPAVVESITGFQVLLDGESLRKVLSVRDCETVRFTYHRACKKELGEDHPSYVELQDRDGKSVKQYPPITVWGYSDDPQTECFLCGMPEAVWVEPERLDDSQ